MEMKMQRTLYALLCASALFAAPQVAFADDNGAGAGIVGGAVAGAVVGGAGGAGGGGGAGGVIGGAATGPRHDTVIVQPGAPCQSRTTQTTDSNGNSSTTQSTNCPN
jgi:hypothetical protein